MNDQDIEALKFEDKIREKKYMLFLVFYFGVLLLDGGYILVKIL
ncbi:hypothetical protein OLQ22_03110 [Campylobacter jejuni]|nr:hypothetical protein [Campylobacter jejuni]